MNGHKAGTAYMFCTTCANWMKRMHMTYDECMNSLDTLPWCKAGEK